MNTLSLSPGHPSTLAAGPAAGAPLVMVVDDNEGIRDLITCLLHTHGYRTVEAPHGAEAKTLFATMQPALVLSDLRMPVGDGWDLLAFCHAQYPDVPFLIISGETPGVQPDVERWAAGVLAKPFDARALFALVEQTISRAAPRSVFDQNRLAGCRPAKRKFPRRCSTTDHSHAPQAPKPTSTRR